MRTIPKSTLVPSPFFQKRLESLSSGLDLLVVHLVADPVQFDMVVRWLRTGQVHNQTGNWPNLYTLGRIIFLADVLELWQLVNQLLAMIANQVYYQDGSAMPDYASIYQNTSANNPFRIYAAESYFQLYSIGKGVPLTALPAEMVADLVGVQFVKHAAATADWKRQSELTLQSVTQQLKEHADAQNRELRRSQQKRYEDLYHAAAATSEAKSVQRWKKIVQDLEAQHATELKEARRTCRALEVEKNLSRAAFPPLSTGASLAQGRDSRIAEIERKSDERLNKLVEESNRRTHEHSTAVTELEQTFESQLARLQREIASLRSGIKTEPKPDPDQAHDHGEKGDSRDTEERNQLLLTSQLEQAVLKKGLEESQATVQELSQALASAQRRSSADIAALSRSLEASEAQHRSAMLDAGKRHAEAEARQTEDQLEIATLKREIAELKRSHPAPKAAGDHSAHDTPHADDGEAKHVQLRTAFHALEAQHAQLEIAYQALAHAKESAIAELTRQHAAAEERRRCEVEQVQKLRDDREQRWEHDFTAQKMMMEGKDCQTRRRITQMKRSHEENRRRLLRQIDGLGKQVELFRRDEAGRKNNRKRSSEDAEVVEGAGEDGGDGKRGRCEVVARR